jgi:hypothetical protein
LRDVECRITRWLRQQAGALYLLFAVSVIAFGLIRFFCGLSLPPKTPEHRAHGTTTGVLHCANPPDVLIQPSVATSIPTIAGPASSDGWRA